MNAPCHKCPDRRIVCHDKCEKYMEFKNQQGAANAERRKSMLAEEYHRVVVARAEKIRRWHS